jgi:hypothetical protein
MPSAPGSQFVVATFADAEALLRAVRAARAASYRTFDAYAPYPIPGLDRAMGIRRTRLPWVTLLAGGGALTFAALFQFYAAVWDWPLNVGGKPDNSSLAFIPVAFELTVLAGGLATVAALFLRARLYPGKVERLLAEGVTDDRFALALRKRDSSFDAQRVRAIMLDCGALEVALKEAQP